MLRGASTKTAAKYRNYAMLLPSRSDPFRSGTLSQHCSSGDGKRQEPSRSAKLVRILDRGSPHS
jgi:hypothetical protein